MSFKSIAFFITLFKTKHNEETMPDIVPKSMCAKYGVIMHHS